MLSCAQVHSCPLFDTHTPAHIIYLYTCIYTCEPVRPFLNGCFQKRPCFPNDLSSEGSGFQSSQAATFRLWVLLKQSLSVIGYSSSSHFQSSVATLSPRHRPFRSKPELCKSSKPYQAVLVCSTFPSIPAHVMVLNFKFDMRVQLA